MTLFLIHMNRPFDFAMHKAAINFAEVKRTDIPSPALRQHVLPRGILRSVRRIECSTPFVTENSDVPRNPKPVYKFQNVLDPEQPRAGKKVCTPGPPRLAALSDREGVHAF